MLVATDYDNVELVGPLGGELGQFHGNAAVEQLQQALTALSQAAGWPAVNPGNVSGTVDAQTVAAIAAVIGNLSGKISKPIQIAIQAGVIVASVSTAAMSKATQVVGQYAGYLTGAVRLLTAVYTKGKKPPTAPPKGFPAPPTPSVTPTVGPVPAGSITTYSPAIRAWRVAVPPGTAAGLGGPSVNLGGMFELPARQTRPATARLVSESVFDKEVGVGFFRLNNPWMWGALGAGVLVLGTGTYLIVRR